MTAVSVVIPTLNRKPALARTLRGFLGQRLEVGFEIIVVDNGSSDGTKDYVRALAREARIEVILLEEPRTGVSTARNAGVAAASGDLVLFANDDTRPADCDLLYGHIAAHRKLAVPCAVAGRIEYEPELDARPFMHWLNEGAQFAYGRMTAGLIGPEHLYTAHASLPRQLLLDLGGMDERLVFGFEDAALGARLTTAGYSVHYEPALLTLHDHPMSLSGWRTRMLRMGAAGYHANERVPQEPSIAPRPHGLRWMLLRMVAPMLAHDWIERIGGVAPAGKLAYMAVNAGSYAAGYRVAERADRAQASTPS